MTSQGAPNRLIHETSPYLLQHAHNPVDWQPWGEAAFEEARQRQVPILLSIGYSTCYWCHVMERQCFEDPQIAEQMNEQFVCIKLDREERPDIDDLYMMATQLLTGQGGWPMNCFLTPPPVSTEADTGNSQQTQANSDKSDVVAPSQTDTAWSNIGPRGLQPFYAGTYFPPTPMHGRPSWPQLLQGITDAWHNRRQEIMQQAQSVTEAIAHERRQIKLNTPVVLTDGPLREAAQQLLSMHDRQHGGFSSAPKFPTPCQLAFIQSLRDQNKAPALGDALALTLDRMARGGIFDQVGGGFHRYSVDGHWLVPHFEKMLYDNAQLLSIYAKAHQQCASQQPKVAQEHARVMRETVAFVGRDMTDPSGAFWSALDAEVDTFEGATYVWQIEDVEAALTENGADDAGLFAFAKKMYGLAGGPNFQDPHHPKAPASSVLFLPQPLDQLGTWDEVVAKRQTINERLLQARQARKQPSTDKKVIASWNGMMIKGLADAAIALNEPTFADLAAKAANGLQALLVQEDGNWCRTACGGKAQGRMLLEDHAWLALGLLALAKAVKQSDKENDDNNAGEDLATHWQQQALGHLEMAMAQFDTQGQVPGLYDAPADATDLILRTQSNHDGATPSANAVMLEAMLEAAGQAEDDITAQVWRSRALQMLEGFYPTLERQGIAMTAMLTGLSQALNNPAPDPTRPVQIVTVGRSSTPEQAVHVELVLKVQEGFHLYATNAHTPASPTEATDADDDLLGATEHPTHTAGINVEATDAHGQLLPVSFTPPTPNDHLIGPDGEAIGIYKSSLRISLDIACLDTEDDMDLWLSYQPCTLEACHPSNRLRIPLPARGENG